MINPYYHSIRLEKFTNISQHVIIHILFHISSSIFFHNLYYISCTFQINFVSVHRVIIICLQPRLHCYLYFCFLIFCDDLYWQESRGTSSLFCVKDLYYRTTQVSSTLSAYGHLSYHFYMQWFYGFTFKCFWAFTLIDIKELHMLFLCSIFCFWMLIFKKIVRPYLLTNAPQSQVRWLQENLC